MYPIRTENSHRIQIKQVELEVVTQRSEQTKLELEHYIKNHTQCEVSGAIYELTQWLPNGMASRHGSIHT